jgi:hypothetical protein
MKDLNYVEMKRFGDFDQPYTKMIMVGTQEPISVFNSFTHKKVTEKSKGYLSAYGSEEEVSESLIQHFRNSGYTEIKTKCFSVGD